ncbi:MAG: hypothetical protein PHN71_07240 [Candidatus Cloacimonetes bacterium]|jgi:tetratricopeptide (TPR) repeat protein|nr:hypothetical protein [Candidatus Cloacimonadota bacterium]MCB5279389.1 hypothetical protein [Candidatus Cloacimonadota bacterium]MCK9332203.1 hypothetical protein [Candidatus Cloacimonadota bacterium]MDD2211100.1 hypothetical protein [Candidatus Cloacimonadota bacterium]MDY0298713.1 hypothetical protein [Candidatus Cloacimonadaceae bacterium]
MRKYACLIITLIMLSLLWGQYDERQILVQQANQLMVQRQYDRAEEVFLQIIAQYPDDINSILQLTQLYLSLSQEVKVEEMLQTHQRHIPENAYTELRIQLLILQGKHEQANSLADSYLEIYGSNRSKYNLIASYFSGRGDNESAIRIFEAARRVHGDDIFAVEIASAAMKCGLYEKALREYLNHSANAQNTNLFIRNQVSEIVREDSTLINVVRNFANTHDNFVIKEIYALALMTIKNYEEALETYKQMPLTYLRNFAAEQLKLGNLDITLKAYRFLGQNAEQPAQRLYYGYEVANIFFQSAQYDSTENIINELLQDPSWNKPKQAGKSSLLVKLRRLKAENDLALGVELNRVRQWIEQTKDYSVYHDEIQELDVDLARFAILDEDFETAKSTLKRIVVQDYLAERHYLEFLLALMQGEKAEADSLMHEYVLKHPDSEYTNDIIYLNMLSINMSDIQLQNFSKAIRMLQLFKPEGIQILVDLFEQNDDEELLMLAIEWSLALGDITQAEVLLAHDFKDELARDYALMLSLFLIQERETEIQLAQEFLKNKPNSIFSPRFRQIISRMSARQISM